MRVEDPVRTDLPAQPELLSVCWQKEFDGSRGMTDPVVQALHAVLRVDAADGHHRHHHMPVGQLRGITSEERFDMVRLSGRQHEIDLVTRNVYPWKGIDHVGHLRHDDSVSAVRRFADQRRLLGMTLLERHFREDRSVGG